MPIDISVKAAATLKQTRELDEREVHTIKSSNIKGHFPHEFHAKNVLFIHSHQPDSIEMYFSNQPNNLYYPDIYLSAPLPWSFLVDLVLSSVLT